MGHNPHPGPKRNLSSNTAGNGRGMNNQPDWSAAEDAVIIAMWPSKATTREIAAEVSKIGDMVRSRDAVIGRAKRLKLGQKVVAFPDWSDEEKDLLKEHWDDAAPLSHIAESYFPKRNAAGLHRMGLYMKLPTPRPNFQGVKTEAQIARQVAAQRGKQQAAAARAAAREAREAQALVDAQVLEIKMHPPANQNTPLSLVAQDERAKREEVWQVDHEVVPLLRVTHRHCKWPIGDPTSDGFGFCGRRPIGTYCPEHTQVAYQPPERRGSKPTKAYATGRR